MTEDQHIIFRQNLAAYALGALDADETYLLDEHLKTCVECNAELANYLAVSEGLLFALPPQKPPAALKQRLAARMLHTRESAFARSIWSIVRIPFRQIGAAAVLLLLLGLSLFSALQLRRLLQQQAELAQRLDIERSAIALLAYPDTQKIPINEGVPGSLLMNTESNTALLFAWGLPVLPEGETYQIWLIDGGGNRVNGGLFVTQPEQTYTLVSVSSPASLNDYVGLGVTIEPWGGSPGPTGAKVLKVNF